MTTRRGGGGGYNGKGPKWKKELRDCFFQAGFHCDLRQGLCCIRYFEWLFFMRALQRHCFLLILGLPSLLQSYPPPPQPKKKWSVFVVLVSVPLSAVKSYNCWVLLLFRGLTVWINNRRQEVRQKNWVSFSFTFRVLCITAEATNSGTPIMLS